MLYFLINFDTVSNRLSPAENDSADDTFRIVLVCTVLETFTGRRVKDQNAKSYIDPLDLKRFMVIFQIYIHTKAYLETLLESALQDIFDR
jgi:hypothetical protein